MKTKYVFHPRDCYVAENEKLYADMAARGWLLEEYGTYLSIFRKAEPAKLRYRIEFATPDASNGETELPEEQLALYKEAGWSYVTGNVYIHVFSTPEESGAPEIHTDPMQQAATMVGFRRRRDFSRLPGILIIYFNIIYFFMTLAVGVGHGSGFERLGNSIIMMWITQTALLTLSVLAVVWSIYASERTSVYTRRLYRQLKRGEPIEHEPKRRYLLHRVVSIILLACCTACAALVIFQWTQHKKYDMPDNADGPYLLLEDLGWQGERTRYWLNGETSFVEFKNSLLARQWHTGEFVSADGQGVYILQDIYEIKNDKLTHLLIAPLLANLADSGSIKRVDDAGLDEAYSGGHFEYIAVKGNTVYHITYNESNAYTNLKLHADALRVLAEHE